jgi:hypothetical protein
MNAPIKLPPEIISRADAKARGLKRYFTGKPCIEGHVSERATSNGTCCQCSCIRTQKEREKHPEKWRKWQQENREKTRDIARRCYAKHKEEYAAAQAKRREENPGRHAEIQRKHREKHRDRIRELARKRSKIIYAAARALRELGVEP